MSKFKLYYAIMLFLTVCLHSFSQQYDSTFLEIEYRLETDSLVNFDKQCIKNTSSVQIGFYGYDRINNEKNEIEYWKSTYFENIDSLMITKTGKDFDLVTLLNQCKNVNHICILNTDVTIINYNKCEPNQVKSLFIDAQLAKIDLRILNKLNVQTISIQVKQKIKLTSKSTTVKVLHFDCYNRKMKYFVKKFLTVTNVVEISEYQLFHINSTSYSKNGVEVDENWNPHKRKR